MIPLIGSLAPDFTAPAVMPNGEVNNNFNFREYSKGSMTILFFWPGDFTYVCPTEVIAFNNRIEEFNFREIKLVGLSVDSIQSHIEWRSTPPSKGGIGQVQFPIVSDIERKIVDIYGSLFKSTSLRSTFVIDPDGIVCHQSTNDLKIGRDIDEIIRIADAVHYSQEYGELCPAGWKKGDKGIKEDKESVIKFLAENAETL